MLNKWPNLWNITVANYVYILMHFRYLATVFAILTIIAKTKQVDKCVLIILKGFYQNALLWSDINSVIILVVASTQFRLWEHEVHVAQTFLSFHPLPAVSPSFSPSLTLSLSLTSSPHHQGKDREHKVTITHPQTLLHALMEDPTCPPHFLPITGPSNP